MGEQDAIIVFASSIRLLFSSFSQSIIFPLGTFKFFTLPYLLKAGTQLLKNSLIFFSIFPDLWC